METTTVDPRLYALVPGLLHTRSMLERDGFMPCGVTLPAALKPAGCPPGATMLGLPITWGDRAGLIVA